MIRQTQKHREILLLWVGCIGLFAGCHSKPATPPASAMAGWHTVVSEDQSYSFSMPGTPKKETTSLGSATVTEYTLKQGKIIHYFYCTEHSESTSSSAEEHLQQAVDLLHKHKGATFLSEKTVTLDGSPGRDLVFNIEKNSMRICQRFFEVKGRTYSMVVAYPQAQDYAKEAALYLDSLKLN